MRKKERKKERVKKRLGNYEKINSGIKTRLIYG